MSVYFVFVRYFVTCFIRIVLFNRIYEVDVIMSFILYKGIMRREEV